MQTIVTRCRQHLYWFLFPLCGSSENIKPDEWFQIFWYFCDQSQRVLRWEEQRRRKKKKKKTKSLFELVVSVPIPNNKIQFWIQFKTPHSYLQGRERLGPQPPSLPCDYIHPLWFDPLTRNVVYLKVILKETEKRFLYCS